MFVSITGFFWVAGDDDEHFTMDRLTGETRLTRGVRDRLITPLLWLQVMVRLKHTVSGRFKMYDVFFSTNLITVAFCLYVIHPGISG